MPAIDHVLLIAAVLLLLSVAASTLSARVGVPSLLLFAGIGMLAGSDGPGGIYFDHPWTAQLVGITALALILFAAGLETNVEATRPVLWKGLSLSTVGVLVSTLLVGAVAVPVLKFTFLEGLLLGAIVSSTDAAAVFNLLRSKGVHLKGRLAQLIEFESGSNDPMAITLAIVIIRLITDAGAGGGSVAMMLIQQLGLGALLGVAGGRAAVAALSRIRLHWDGLYPVFSLTVALLVYAGTASVGGNGFLAVYIAGVMIGQRNIIHRSTVRLFHDGLAWLAQIVMFLVLGLQVFPSRLPQIAGAGLTVAFFLMFVARPLSVFVALPAGVSARERLLIAWAGLRGAAPIVLATFPLLAGLPRSDVIFHVVFFVALTSLLLQGTTIPRVARWLGLQSEAPGKRVFPLLFNPATATDRQVLELEVARGASAEGRRIMELGLPPGVLILMVNRKDQFVVPQGGTILRAEDRALIMADGTKSAAVRAIFTG
ncbi:MAG: potassium/proton antiporter [Acidobacteria bacterium]|nr:potassium/proton antiporter [Acidobacteriota bacterium]